ncbi:uncharacterized protein LOC135088981 isoform X1 [Scylla paramamosain]|uniref:uncharacterized protein LOC135088981 isoform X1 n=1 Tax=Scylla paramamosain TaxID=85552 RepID=UPI00308368C9
MHTPKSVLVAVCLVCLTPVLAAADGDADGEVLKAEARYVTHDEKGFGKLQIAVPIAAHGAVIVAVVVFFRELALGIADRLDYEYEYEYDYDYAPELFERYDAPHQGYQGRPARRRPARDTQAGTLTRLTDIIDPVEATFSLLQVNDMSCRQRVVCEVQRSASAVPLIGSFLQQLSTSIPGLQHYREAQFAGAALEDCALLFANCPEESLVEN